ncbi:MAG TPA: hypothetical protein VIX86_02730 [Streptosporangiaceae bacterium]
MATAAIGVAAVLAGCGSSPSHPAGPPKAGALAAKLGCRVAHADPDPQWASDTVQYVDATGGPCSNGTDASLNIVIVTFASKARENVWLHQNEIGVNSSVVVGYYQLAVGHLWAVASDSGGLSSGPGHIVRILGGKNTTF